MLELSPENKLRLYSQITKRMEQLNINPMDYSEMGLGFDLPAGWPMDQEHPPTMAELVVIAAKLKMQLLISDINIIPVKEQ